MTKKKLILVLGAAVASIAIVAVGIFAAVHFMGGDVNQPATETVEAAIDGATIPSGATRVDDIRPTGEDPIYNPNHWAQQFPYQVETFNKTRTVTSVDYLELFPFLRTIYEGSRFAVAYDSPRPHDNALEDVKASPRVNDATPAACFACKTPDFVTMEARDPRGTWPRGFTEVADQMTQTITCYDCHRNTPGRGVEGDGFFDTGWVGSIRSHFGVWYEETRPATAACGQCHTEYYISPDTRQVVLPAGIVDPTTILEFYNSIDLVDHTNPRTGTQQVKAQHPEYQHFSGSIHQELGLTCVDCHAVRSTPDGVGGFITSHFIQSPSQSEEILQSCGSCHRGGNQAVRDLITRTQASMNERTNDLGLRIADFMDSFAAAQAAGSLNSETITEIRSLERAAVWYFDWVFTENGDGVHNLEGAHEWLDRGERALSEAWTLLKASQ